MQANQLWAGSDYAWTEYRSRGVFPLNARRVRIIRVFQEKDRYYSERAKTYAQVNFIDDEGNVKSRNGQEIVRKVKARDIVNHWDSYVDERDARVRQAEERQRIWAEERAQQDAQNQAIVDFLVKIGVPEDAISTGYGNSISISKGVIWEWMKEQQVQSVPSQ